MGKLLRLNEIDNEKLPQANLNSLRKKTKFSFRLIDFKNSLYQTDGLIDNRRCHLEISEAGIMISGNFSDNFKAIPVMAKEIQWIGLIRGKELIETFYLSPMYILTKLGFPNRITRYFSFHPSEYRISETRILIKAKEHEMLLITSGYRFEGLLESFINMGYGPKLEVVKKPSRKLIEYSTDLSLLKVPFL